MRISHACDGSLLLNVRHLPRAGAGRSSDHVASSGQSIDFPVAVDDRVELSFTPAPTPPGNEPHELEAAAHGRVQLSRFGKRQPTAKNEAGSVLAIVEGDAEDPTEKGGRFLSFPTGERITLGYA